MDFNTLQQKIKEKENEEKENCYWQFHVNKWIFRQKAFAEIRSLFTQLGGDQFIKLASDSILTDPSECCPSELFQLLEDADKLGGLGDEYLEEIAEINRKYLSKIFKNPDNIEQTVEYIIDSIADETISTSIIDAIRLHPDSTLFSKENVEKYRESLKDHDWLKTDDSAIRNTFINEAIEFGNNYILEKNYTCANKMYRTALAIIENDDKLIINMLFRQFLCDCIVTSYRLKISLIQFSKEYPIFAETKECEYIKSITNFVNINFKRELEEQSKANITELTDKYLEENEVDPIVKILLLEIKK